MQSSNKTKKKKLLKIKMSFMICEYLIESHSSCTSSNKTIESKFTKNNLLNFKNKKIILCVQFQLSR